MAVVKNTFTTTLDTITSGSYTMNGLTSETSTNNLSYISPQISEHFLTAIYQTLLDAGYTDARMNTADYSITVLGFKFFALCRTYSTSGNFGATPLIYNHGINAAFLFSENDTYYINNTSNYYNFSYKIVVRGDENCVGIWYGSYKYPNSEIPLIFIAKAKNLITGEDAYCFCNRWYYNSSSYPIYFKNKSNVYNLINGAIGSYSSFMEYPGYSGGTGLNTASKYVCEPVLGYWGTYLVQSAIKGSDTLHVRGGYYKIGDDMYFCYGYKESSSTSYSGASLLMKIS